MDKWTQDHVKCWMPARYPSPSSYSTFRVSNSLNGTSRLWMTTGCDRVTHDANKQCSIKASLPLNYSGCRDRIKMEHSLSLFRPILLLLVRTPPLGSALLMMTVMSTVTTWQVMAFMRQANAKFLSSCVTTDTTDPQLQVLKPYPEINHLAMI